MGLTQPDYAREVRASLTDPRKLCDALGLTKGAVRQAGGGLYVRCPAHGDRSPSCSVRRGPDGTVSVHCFGCGFGGDALTLVAVVHSLDVRNNFREVLTEAAQIAGLHSVVDELRGQAEYTPRPAPAIPDPEPDREYPPLDEVTDVWEAGGSADLDQTAASYLRGRKLDPIAATELGLLRVLPTFSDLPLTLPAWARYGALSWQRSGHRLMVPVYDHTGAMRSLRAWRIEGTAPAKRIPPVGHKATGLLMASREALTLLRKACSPRRVLVVEGEPDFAVAAIRWSQLAIFGVVSGGWNEGFASRVPLGSEVLVATHHDEAGDKYAAIVANTVKSRAVVNRSAA